MRRTRRNRLRFSVRGMIVLVLVVGCGAGWIVRGVRIQREAVAEIRRAGGWVIYDWQYDRGQYIATGKPWAPDWLVAILGEDSIGHVAYAQVVNGGGSDAVMSQIGRLSRLEGLDLPMVPVTDVGLSHVRGLKILRKLGLYSRSITDAGLVHLRDLASLEDLCLHDTGVTGPGLAYLKELRSLRHLSLVGSRISRAGLGHLRQMPNLLSLDLTACGVSNAELFELQAASQAFLLGWTPP